MDQKQEGNQPGYPQQGCDGGYASLPGYVAQPGYAVQPGYTAQPQQGHSYNHSAVIVTQPVAAIPVVHSVTDNMGLAVFATICCCWPIGIFAIMKASESRTALASGDFQRAQTLSQQSRRFALFSVLGGIGSVIIVIISVVVRITNRSSYYYNSY